MEGNISNDLIASQDRETVEIEPVRSFTVRETDDFQATITLGPVNRAGQDLSASLELMITLPMPDQDDASPTRSRRPSLPPVWRSSGGSSGRSSRRPIARWSWRVVTAKGVRASSGGGRAPSRSRRASARSPSSAVGSVTSETARGRSPRRRRGARLINWPSPGTSVTRSVIRGVSNLPARASRRSANRPATPTCWGGARSSRSCTNKGSV